MDDFTNFGIVAKANISGEMFSRIDFSDLEISDNSYDKIVINLQLKSRIHHTLPLIDRCCKSEGMILKYNNINTNNMERISCDMSKSEFKKEYIDKRRVVMLTGCQEEWKARNWTISSLLNRYKSKWPLSWYHGKYEDCYAGYVDGPTIGKMVENRVKLKSFTHLAKSIKNQIKEKRFDYFSIFSTN